MATEAEVQEASSMGWADKDHWKGPAEHWVDADVFLERGRTILPIMKENNQRLQGKLAEQAAENEKLKQSVAELTASMEDFKTFHSEEVKRKTKELKRDLNVAIEEARKEGNIDAVLSLQEKLEGLEEASKAAPPAKKEEKPPVTENVTEASPELKAWMDANPWFGDDDPVKSHLVMGIGQKIKKDPATAHLVGKPFFDELDKQVAEFYGPGKKPPSKMEGGGGGAGGETGSGGQGFDGLPADAQAYAKSQTPKMVGAGKPFKDEASWLKYYAEQY